MSRHIITPDGFVVEDWVWELSRTDEVFIKGDDGEFYQVLDLRGEEEYE